METQLALELLEIIQTNYFYSPNEDGRLLRHLQLLAERYFLHQQLSKDYSNLYQSNEKDILKNKKTIDQINDFLISNYSFKLTSYESICLVLYLCQLKKKA